MENVKTIDKIAAFLGALDIGYVILTIVGMMSKGLGLAGFRQNLSAFGTPFPVMIMLLIMIVYLILALCGISLVLRWRKLAWLNYVLLPLRIALVMPTLYPIYILISYMGILLSVPEKFISLVVVEMARCVFVFYWVRKGRWRSWAY